MMFTDWITSQVGDDPDLLAKVVPDYPATGKRTLQDNGSWLRTLTRDNVDLVRTGIDHIEPDAVVTDDGVRHRGRRHRVRHRVPARPSCCGRWTITRPRRRRPRARGGASGRRRTSASRCPSFPNLFCMYGPGTNLAHGGSLIFHSECQMRYITQCLELLIAGGTGRWSRARTSTTTGTSAARPRCATLVWSQPSIKHSFFKNAYGEVHTLSPWRLVDYWAWTRTPDPDDFVIT